MTERRPRNEGTPSEPRINNSLFYLKLTLCELGESDEYMLVISAHPDH